MTGAGSLYAHVFENRATGVGRGLFWAFDIDLDPLEAAGESWDRSIQCEWLTWNVKRWTEPDGVCLANVSAPDMVECSLYLAEHQPLLLESLRIRRHAGAEFSATVTARGRVEMPDGHVHPSTLFSVDALLRFEGIYVVPDNLFPKPGTEEDAARVVEPFISVDDFEPPIRDQFRFELSPR